MVVGPDLLAVPLQELPGECVMHHSPLLQHGLDHGPIFQLPGLQQVDALEFAGRNKVGSHRGVRNHFDVAAGDARDRDEHESCSDEDLQRFHWPSHF